MPLTFVRRPVPFRQQLRFIFLLMIFMAAIELVNSLTGRSLNRFGLIPGETEGLIGIIFAPFLHGNLNHFLSNMPPLALFTLLVFQHGRWRFWLATGGIILFGGLLVWLFGRRNIHIGASGWVFGYFGYLVVAGWVSREFKLLAISVFVGITYGGMLWGVLPIHAWVSFESHLFGLIAGVAMALLIGRSRRLS